MAGSDGMVNCLLKESTSIFLPVLEFVSPLFTLDMLGTGAGGKLYCVRDFANLLPRPLTVECLTGADRFMVSGSRLLSACSITSKASRYFIFLMASPELFSTCLGGTRESAAVGGGELMVGRT